MSNKNRLDIILVEQNLFESREKAKRSIMAGIVFVNEQRIDKPGTAVDIGSKIEIRGNPLPYVSRGGLKLEKALKHFDISLYNKTALDIGASTGGFTDCMLQNGVSKVFAIDVGYGQLAWELRQDSRVIPMERTNIRYTKENDIGKKVDFASIDVSFISLTLVLPVTKQLIKPTGEIVCLIKPQFEAGKEDVGKKGIIKDKKIHKKVIQNILSFAIETGFSIGGLTYSPIKGPKGNIEYLLYLVNKKSELHTDYTGLIDRVVSKSHLELNNK